MNVKHLRKQLMAAIAMVVVAGVALSSATYAWFVSNNSVKATTTSIAAQSNSAYLLIANKDAGATTHNSASIAVNKSEADTISLYPAQWKNNFAADKTTTGDKVYQFESAYASATGKPDEKENTRFAVGDPAAAVTAKYAYLNTFHVGTGNYDGSFTNLKVKSVTVNKTDSVPTGADVKNLTTALRVLVVCGNEWTVFSGTGIESGSHTSGETPAADGIIRTGAFGKSATGDGSVAGDVQVDVYVYYDGADDSVYSDNLDKININGVSATVEFEATPAEFK